MDTTHWATVEHENAHKIAHLFVELEGCRGCFSGRLINYRMPCAASENTSCEIIAIVPLWTEFICQLELSYPEKEGNSEWCTSLTFVIRCRKKPHSIRQPHFCSGSRIYITA
ncbi:hypothetical protein MRX96_056958 [Rhipicephalus microplus]